MTGLDRKHLRLQDIQQLMRFSFVPRRQLSGGYVGKHATPQRGQSVEFRDFRPYAPGDDIGHVDWKVYGRSDKLYVRLFEHETELSVFLLVDGSNSMDYERVVSYPQGQGRNPDHGSRPAVPWSKYDHACQLAAALGFVVLHGQDRVGFALAREGRLFDHQSPAHSLATFTQILDAMQNRRPQNVARLGDCLQQLAQQMSAGDTIVVCSDLWEDLDQFFTAAARIRHLGGDLILFHVLHPHELTLPPGGSVELFDSERALRLQVNLDTLRPAYVRHMQARLAEIEARCKQADLQYQFAPLAEPYPRTLERFLERRSS